MPTTRYPGVTSFPDTKLAHQLFFGREEDSQKLYYFIASETLTVLYSKSGYGKTSILQAGVFSMLREDNYYPLSVRLNKRGSSPQQLLALEIQSINDQAGYEAIIPAGATQLKDIFKTLEIWSPANKLLTPVIVLDQFEEIFTLEHNQIYQNTFIEELAQAMNEVREGALKVKFVISIREDFLGHLEKLAVMIPSIFSNRFRLEALSKTAAKEAIEKPAQIEIKGTTFDSPPIEFVPAAMDELLTFLSLKITEGKWIKTDEVEPVQLQIICSELEERAMTGKVNGPNGSYRINKADLGGDEGLRNILGSFYDKQLRKAAEENKLTEDEIIALRNVVEKELIVGKRRVPMAYEAITARKNIRQEAVDSLIRNKLLKKDSYQQNFLVEISHDALVEPILRSFEVRETKEKQLRAELKLIETEQALRTNKKVLRQRSYALYFLIFSLLAGAAWMIFTYFEVKSKTDESNRILALNTAKIISLDSTLKEKQGRIDSIKKDNSSIVTYLKTVGTDSTINQHQLEEATRADAEIKRLLAIPGNKLDTTLRIQYFRNNLDNIKIWISLKEIGYKNFSNLPSRVNEGMVNGIFYDVDTRLLDLKIIALTLIKSGLKLQRIADTDKASTLQIITKKYRPNEHPPTPLTVEEVIGAQKTTDLNKGFKS